MIAIARVTTTGRRDRGSFMLGFAGLIVVLGVLCGSVLLRSLETYRNSAFHLWRLQSRAAAEGAAVVLTRAGTAAAPEPLVLGDAVVTAGGAEPAGTQDGGTTGVISIPLHVEIRKGERPVYMERYAARLVPPEEAATGGRTWKLLALEVIR